MSRYKILVTSPAFNKDNLKSYREELENLGEVIYNPSEKPMDTNELISKIKNVDAILAGLDTFNQQVLSHASEKLKIITRFGAGYERVDIEAAGKRGIAVANTPGANASGVADLAIGLMIDISRKISDLNDSIKNGHWTRPMGTELTGKTLGILGFGAIGKEVAQRARGFSMEILAYDPFVIQEKADEYDTSLVSMEEIIEKSDIITLHLPIVNETFRLINRDRISYMKRGVIIINTARGSLLDEEAVYEAVKSGHIRGVGLDAFEEEPPVNNRLLKLDQVISTPHIGAHTLESSIRMADMAVENIKAYLAQGKCSRIVNKQFLK